MRTPDDHTLPTEAITFDPQETHTLFGALVADLARKGVLALHLASVADGLDAPMRDAFHRDLARVLATGPARDLPVEHRPPAPTPDGPGTVGTALPGAGPSPTPAARTAAGLAPPWDFGRMSIDGPNAAGKTTLMLGLAHALGMPGLDTGPTYRAVAAHAIPQGIPPTDLAHHLTIVIRPGLAQRLLWRGIDIRDDDLFGPRAGANIGHVAGDPYWREAIRDLHAHICAQHRDIVVVGRDVAPTLLSDATLNVFLTADLPVRHTRRELQWAHHPERPVHVDALTERDLATRAWIAEHRPQAHRLDLDTTTLRIDQVLDTVVHSIPG
ncbi:(d)CMP kinase [Embleya scabrispora]|uniref:(d)CMP kinase n=1 Tax=Embleya scabrispora TaxID=159449 RepID=UPI001374CE15|nr:(d)CMP kinase [Embleya scabrispora]